jgi:hypothetical protein
LFSQFWAVWKGIFDFILEKLPEDIKLCTKKEVGATSSLPTFFCSIFFYQKFWQFFLQKKLFFEFTPGIKIRNNSLWRFFFFKGIAGEKNRCPPHSPSKCFKSPTFHKCNQWEAGTPRWGGGLFFTNSLLGGGGGVGMS